MNDADRTLVVSLGGKVLHLADGDGPAQDSFERALDQLASLAARHRLLVSHGSEAPLQMSAEQAPTGARAQALDAVAALSGGRQGDLVGTELRRRRPEQEVVTLPTEALIDIDDPGFASPTVAVGPIIDRAAARALEREKGWSFQAVRGGCRRVLALLQPVEIVQLQAIRALLDRGALVVCGGAGTVPVVRGDDGLLHGVDGVVDCDRAAVLLARGVSADGLLLLTDVDCVERDHGSAISHPIREMTPEEVHLEEFDAETIRPKLRAAREFVQTTSGFAAIGRASDAVAVLEGRTGTHIVHPCQEGVEELDKEFRRLEERSGDLASDTHIVRRLQDAAQHGLEELP